jgi:hypothetical protein
MKRYTSILQVLFLVFFIASSVHGSTHPPVPSAPPKDETLYMTGPDTLLFSDFDDVAVGDVPEDWNAIDLSAIPDSTLWFITGDHGVEESSSWWCGTLEGLPHWGWMATPPGYGNLWRQFLELSYDLTGYTGTIGLQFHNWYQLEYASPTDPFDTWDAANVRISTDEGATWEVLEPIGGYPYQACYAFWLADGDTVPGFSNKSGDDLFLPEWEEIQFNLSNYKNTTGIIRFYMCADMYTSDEDGQFNSDFGAWAIDNVLIGTAKGDTIFFDDMEGGEKPEWHAEAHPPNVVGNFWQTVDSTHPQPDDRDVYYSEPHGMYCGDPNSSQGDGTYYVGDHNSWGLDNVLLLPEIDLTNWDNPLLTFMHRVAADATGGYCTVDVSEDGGLTWEDYTGWQVEDRDWHSFQTSLNTFEGDKILLRIHTKTGTLETHYVYWYLDDVLISGTELHGVNSVHLSAVLDGDAVLLNWRSSGDPAKGYYVSRRRDEGIYTRLTTGLLEPGVEVFEDGQLQPNSMYTYRVAMVTDEGDEVTSNEVRVHFSTIPTRAVLAQNTPNPFNPTTVIRYSVPDLGNVQLPVEIAIYNVKGELIRTLVNHPQSSGSYQTRWNGRDQNGQTVSSGIYYCRLKCGDESDMRKMVLMK